VIRIVSEHGKEGRVALVRTPKGFVVAIFLSCPLCLLADLSLHQLHFLFFV